MTEELVLSIEGLYKTFSKYPFLSTMDGCPCCVSDTDKEKIHTKQLRQLDGEDLSRFTFKAMTTWGDTDDFKHYLPRIFELLSTTDFIVDTTVVLGKLEYGKWKTWTIEEQKAIHDFLLAWWTNMTKNKSYFDREAFIGIYKILGEIDTLLDKWEITFNNNSFKILIDLLDSYYHDLTNKRNQFKEVDKNSIDKLLIWLTEKQEIIENGYFHYESIDKELADKISSTIYIMERTTEKQKGSP